MRIRIMRRLIMRRNGIALIAGLLIPAGLCLAQPRRKQLPPDSAATDAPAPTMSSGAAGVRTVSDDAGSGSGSGPQAGLNTTAAMERYRQMWQRMTPAQQKVFVQHGGRTPEDYERMLKGSASQFAAGRTGGPQGNAPARGSDPRETGKAINPGDLDSISKSLQDLNAIRDGNLGRVQRDGCPPEIASRTAELRSRLQSEEFELNGGRPPAAVPTAGLPKKSGQADPLAIAGDWFKRPAEQKSAASGSGNGNARGATLLDGILPTAENATESASAAPKPGIASNSPEAVQRRNALLEEITRIKAELAQLSGACAASRQ